MAKIVLTFFLPVLLLCAGVQCDVTFNFENLCTYPVWRASNPSIGDLEPQIGTDVFEIFNMDDHYSGSIWLRTACTTNASNYFSCETGDCGNGIMECADLNPAFPVTLLNFRVDNPVVSYQVSLVHGQNILVRIKPNGGTLVDGSGPCPMVDCNKELSSVCPFSLIAFNKGGQYVGCNSPCDGLKDPKYCCDGHGCQSDEISLKYKGLCPLAHTYPGDNNPPFYQCKGAESYDITFCPAL
ncbi:unnamed protein product [Sphenostylis stenocarpa]|uniref:Thaumatin-like protein n=1 Tax=Sphenostylis stenocarpa TaxID=92480 RepID=A0AA86SPD6_9FABA|nr:unnamed protein product [Sphenostylis stenocarpa]